MLAPNIGRRPTVGRVAGGHCVERIRPHTPAHTAGRDARPAGADSYEGGTDAEHFDPLRHRRRCALARAGRTARHPSAARPSAPRGRGRRADPRRPLAGQRRCRRRPVHADRGAAGDGDGAGRPAHKAPAPAACRAVAARVPSARGTVSLSIRLLGRPALHRDGQPAATPRGRKAWALLAYLALAEGMSFAAAATFESWLLVERRRLAGAMEGVLHESALARLAAVEPDAAIGLARRATTLNPLDENHQELLVRCLAGSGDRGAARAQAEACEELFRRELGYEPSPAVRRAADEPEPARRREAGSRTAARGLLEAGRAAISAGATEAAASLHRPLTLAERADAREIATIAHRELGGVGVVAGRHEQAVSHLAQAEEFAEGDSETAAVLGVRGMLCSDTADYPGALARLGESLRRAERAGDRRQLVFSSAMLARARLLRGELAEAAGVAERSIADAKEERWLAYLPFPETTRAEVDRVRGDLARAQERFEHAFTLGCQLGDPCWEAFSA